MGRNLEIFKNFHIVVWMQWGCLTKSSGYNLHPKRGPLGFFQDFMFVLDPKGETLGFFQEFMFVLDPKGGPLGFV